MPTGISHAFKEKDACNLCIKVSVCIIVFINSMKTAIYGIYTFCYVFTHIRNSNKNSLRKCSSTVKDISQN